MLGDGLSDDEAVARCRASRVPLLRQVPLIGPVLFTEQSVLTYVGFILVPLAVFWIDRTRPGLHLRAVGERPAAADAQGIDVYGSATSTCSSAGCWPASPGADDHAGHLTRLVRAADRERARLDRDRARDLRPVEPVRAAIGAYLFGAIFRFIIDIQGVPTILGIENPFQAGRSATFFLEMLPYAFVIVVVVIGSREALRRRVGAPAALGIPYVRGERGA